MYVGPEFSPPRVPHPPHRVPRARGSHGEAGAVSRSLVAVIGHVRTGYHRRDRAARPPPPRCRPSGADVTARITCNPRSCRVLHACLELQNRAARQLLPRAPPPTRPPPPHRCATAEFLSMSWYQELGSHDPRLSARYSQSGQRRPSRAQPRPPNAECRRPQGPHITGACACVRAPLLQNPASTQRFDGRTSSSPKHALGRALR